MPRARSMRWADGARLLDPRPCAPIVRIRVKVNVFCADNGEDCAATSSAVGANAAPAEPEMTTGFGAPIWVVLVAVVGSALMTVSLVVREIKNPVRLPGDQPGDFHERINALVQHQLFVVFAPLGGIFVYQGLVVGRAANEPVTVAIAALGAGATLNALLGLAVQKAEAVLNKVTST